MSLWVFDGFARHSGGGIQQCTILFRVFRDTEGGREFFHLRLRSNVLTPEITKYWLIPDQARLMEYAMREIEASLTAQDVSLVDSSGHTLSVSAALFREWQ